MVTTITRKEDVNPSEEEVEKTEVEVPAPLRRWDDPDYMSFDWTGQAETSTEALRKAQIDLNHLIDEGWATDNWVITSVDRRWTPDEGTTYTVCFAGKRKKK